MGVDPPRVAMEPGLGGQEKPHPEAVKPHTQPVAMEPGLGGQEKLTTDTQERIRLLVAMEPGLGGQEKLHNTVYGITESLKSQWSLALAARKRLRSSGGVLQSVCRNGAWPWRPGKEEL